ncbi:hypothetical protein C5167_049651 [Papaver somniferum]|uniref:Uncharacterized protein n=1 Tax=Papaver somniferum TaxID=3469 RepID=A0A4Y7KPS6_PAPSO|nr:hypothetical protein C5167_049651 [Papaver somniferum]
MNEEDMIECVNKRYSHISGFFFSTDFKFFRNPHVFGIENHHCCTHHESSTEYSVQLDMGTYPFLPCMCLY